MRPEFRQRPGADLESVQQEMKLAFDRLGDIVPRRIPNVRVGTEETRIAHGHPSVPSQWRAVNHRAGVVIEQTRPADEKFLYLKRQQDISADLGGECDPRMNRLTAQWHAWGVDLGKTDFSGGDFAKTCNLTPNFAVTSNDCPMTAIPAWFPEAGTITQIAIGTGDNTLGGSEFGWFGIAPNRVVSGDQYPGATDGTTVQVITTLGTLANRWSGGTINLAVAAGTRLWWILQTKNRISSWAACSLETFPNWGGFTDMSAVAVGGTFPGPPGAGARTGTTGVGYCSRLADLPVTYTHGRDFPDPPVRLLLTDDGATTAANQAWVSPSHGNPTGGIPMFWYQWTRSASAAVNTGGATILNSSDAVTDIEVL